MADDVVPDPLSGIVFILDRPQDIVNVGAVVRLMGNFGLSRLRLVEPAAYDEGRILSVARRGQAVLERVEHHHSLESALADCAFVLGATRRRRELDRPVFTPRQAAPALLALSGGGSGQVVAVLFGPEDFGLANTALDRCHGILTIPALPRDASLNLAQAALLVAYELRLAVPSDEVVDELASTGGQDRVHLPIALPVDGENLADGATMEALFDALLALLLALHQPSIEGRTSSTMARLRALLLRAVPRKEEAVLLTGLFQHAAHAVRREQGPSRT